MELLKICRITLVKSAVATIALSCSVVLYAADFSLGGTNTINTITISQSSLPSDFTTTPEISIGGIVEKVVNVPVTSGFGIPSFAFTLVQDSPTDGTFQFKVAIVIDDENSARRLEAFIGNLTLTVSGSGSSVIGTIPSGQNLELLGRDDLSSFIVQADIPNTTAEDPVTISGNVVTFDAATLITRLQANDPVAFSGIITSFNVPAHYNYLILVEQASASTLRFGTKSGGTFTALPRVQTSCPKNTGSQLSNLLVLNSGEFVPKFSKAYALQGLFDVDGSSASYTTTLAAFSEDCTIASTGSVATAGIDDTNITDEADSVDTALEGFDPTLPDADNVTALETILGSATTLGNSITESIENDTVSTDVALAAVDSITSSLANAATLTQNGGELDNTVVNSTLSTIADVFNALDDAGTTLSSAEIADVQSATESTLDAITNVFTSSTKLDAAQILISNISDVMGAALSVGASLDSDLLSSAQTLTQTALENTLSDIATALDSSLNVTFSDVTTTQTLLSNNTQLLSAVLDIVQIPLTSTVALNQTTTASTLETSGLSSNDASALATNLAQFVNPTGISQTNASDQTITAEDTIASSLSSLGSASVSTDASTGLVSITLANDTFPVNLGSVVIVPASIPEGITLLPDGSALSVSDGIASTLLPAPKDPVGFASALSGLSGNFDVAFDDDGSIAITNASGTNFSATFAFNGISGGSSSTGDVTFSTPTGDPASPSYTYKVNYPDGTSQNILPFVADDDIFDSLAGRGFEVSTNRSTGVMTIGGSKYKPDYFVTPLSSADTDFLNARQDSTRTAYRVTDANGDDLRDYEAISSTGVQVIYAVP